MNFEDTRIKNDPILRTKLQMLELARASGNVSYACEKAGYSRDTFYRVKAAFEARGIDGLLHASRGKPNLKNRVPPLVRQAVIELSLKHPELGQARIAREISARGMIISAAGVRSVWIREGLRTMIERMQRRADAPLQEQSFEWQELKKVA